MRPRLDQYLVGRGLVQSRSQAESYIRLGQVQVNGQIVTKTGYSVGPKDKVYLTSTEQYVSRAGLKLASVVKELGLNFKNKVVLDVGSSTGGFTDYALQHGASRVVAVDVGTNQLHPSLRNDDRIDLHEQTDIRNFSIAGNLEIDLVVIDVSFISLREILPHIALLVSPKSQIIAMVKPQFESGAEQKNKGVIKNDSMRREILKDFESWVSSTYKIHAKADSKVPGEKGNLERFYKLTLLKASQ